MYMEAQSSSAIIKYSRQYPRFMKCPIAKRNACLDTSWSRYRGHSETEKGTRNADFILTENIYSHTPGIMIFNPCSVAFPHTERVQSSILPSMPIIKKKHYLSCDLHSPPLAVLESWLCGSE